tara:strand:- start:2834 stop:3346 length:513 start_codon:yes stop_codon:yes gene_type:complete
MFAKLVRLGKDAELRSLNNGDKVASLAMVYDVGYGANKRSQWIDGTLWGKRAESLAPYLTKGSQIVLYADDIELETYPKNDGSTGSKLKCRVNDVSLISGQGEQSQQAPQAPQQAPQQQQYQQAPQQQQGQYQPQPSPHSNGSYQQQQGARQQGQQGQQAPGGFDDGPPF